MKTEDRLHQRLLAVRATWKAELRPWQTARIRMHLLTLRFATRSSPVKIAWLVAITSAAVAVAITVGVSFRGRAVHEDPASIRLADDSLIERLTPDTLVTESIGVDDRRAELTAGRARFRIKRDARRPFRVAAGFATIEVLGTVFTVERSPSQTIVAVEEGRVRVTYLGRSQELGAGERGAFPPRAPSTLQTRAAPVAVEDSQPPPPTYPSSHAETRPAAAGAQMPRTNRPLTRSKAKAADAESEALMLAAEAARSQQRIDEALVLLERVYRTRPTSPLAPLAAFTAGTLLGDKLKSHRRAAAAFEAAASLANNEVLEEASVARQVQAHAMAGNIERARAAAAVYARRYPFGPNRGAIRRWLPTP